MYASLVRSAVKHIQTNFYHDTKLEDVAIKDPQVALLLLRMCSSFSKLVHLARTTPTTLIFEAMQQFDTDVRRCLSSCLANCITNSAWHQAQISLSRGGLGLRSLSKHSCAAFIASFCSSGFAALDNSHLIQAVARFNELVPPSDAITVTSLVATPPRQRSLSTKLDLFDFQLLLDQSSLADKARLLSVSAPHAAAWLSVIPSVGLGLHLDPEECRTALKWWLSVETAHGSNCALCPDSALDPHGHHAVTCKRGGDAVLRHYKLRDILVESFHRAHIRVQVEAGSGLSQDHSNSRPADILVFDWDQGKPAALDLTVISPLNANILKEAGMTAGAAAQAAEVRKHTANGQRCTNLGWSCIPLAVESYGAWGREAQMCFTLLATRLAVHNSSSKSKIIFELYSRLNLALTRSIARAIITRSKILSTKLIL